MTYEDQESAMAPDSFLLDDKPLSQWRYELRTLGKRHWNLFYEHFLGSRISNYARFFRALKLYDGMYLFEAVLQTAKQPIEGDPLNYVLKVAHELWKEEQLEYEHNQDYEREVQEAIAASQLKNKEMAARLKKLGRK